MPEEAFNIYDLLDEMREKPAMYLGYKSIIRLSAYLTGYDHAMDNLGVKDCSSPPLLGSLMFHDWVAERLGYSYSTAGWCNIILAEVLGWSPEHHNWEELNQGIKLADDAAALDRFYKLLDEYRADPPQPGPALHERRWAEDE